MVPLFLLVVFTILEASLWVHASAVAQAAAQDGVRAGTALGAGQEEGQLTAEQILRHRNVGEDWVVTVRTTPDTLTVTVTGHPLTVIPGLGLPVRESAELPWEGS